MYSSGSCGYRAVPELWNCHHCTRTAAHYRLHLCLICLQVNFSHTAQGDPESLTHTPALSFFVYIVVVLMIVIKHIINMYFVVLCHFGLSSLYVTFLLGVLVHE